MNLTDFEFLDEVSKRSRNSEMAKKIVMAAINGALVSAVEVRSHAVDMEAVAMMALNEALFKKQRTYIANTLEKWQHMNALRWDYQIKKLREGK